MAARVRSYLRHLLRGFSSQRLSRRLLPSAAIALLATSAADAQNLLPNGTFDTDLNGWVRSAFVGVWSPDDADGSPSSGSVHYLHDENSGGAFLRTCVNVAAGQNYDVRGDVRLTPIATQSSRARLSARRYASPNCVGGSGQVTTILDLRADAATGLWTPLDGEFTPEAEVASLGIELTISGGAQPVEVNMDNLEFCLEGTCDAIGPPPGTCVPGPWTACLLDGRFQVTVEWGDFEGGMGDGRLMEFEGVRAESDESAFFWFFSPTNFEMGVKMVDACVPQFDRYWVFVSGLTNVSYAVRVLDTLTGAERAYTNPLGMLPQTVGDTGAFPCDG